MELETMGPLIELPPSENKWEMRVFRGVVYLLNQDHGAYWIDGGQLKKVEAAPDGLLIAGDGLIVTLAKRPQIR